MSIFFLLYFCFKIKGKREKLGNGYRKVRASYENIMILHRNLIEPEASTKLVETMEYFSILNQVALQRLVAHEMKHRVIQLESNKELKNIGESEIIIMAIKKIIYDNLNYLINNEVLKANDDFVAPNFCLVVIQYLLEQKYFKPDESLVIFKNEKALNLLAGHFEILAGASTGRPDIFYAIDILDDFMKVPKMSDVALIYHSLESRQKKYLLRKLLKFFAHVFNLEEHLLHSQSKINVLEESYKSLVDVNFDIGNWLNKYDNFRFINQLDDPLDFLYHLTLYHILKCHMKFNPEQLSEAAITVIVTNENALKECFGEYFNKENDFFKLDL
ncbi:expressed protein, partial [Phakopsora pachyrhizi]